jgi:acetate kinase
LDAGSRRRPPGRARLDLALLIVLVVNAGSTSLKLSLVGEDDEARSLSSLDAAPENVGAVAHRVVHGGARFREPVLVDDEVAAALDDLAELAPLHNAPALRALGRARRQFPALPHVAVFDTAFHVSIPDVAAAYALPHRLRDELGIRRYGFHGLSVQWASEQVHVPRLVVCHLGGGCSVTAVRDGRSVDTTMGFTPLEGVPMATRSGSIDPGAILHLLRSGAAGVDELDQALEYESGLLGLSGISGDVEELTRSHEPAAAFALDVFSYRVAGAVAAMACALGGLDALVFTAGIGENASSIREATCARLGFLGVELDPRANAYAEPDADVGGAKSSVRVLILRAREDLIAARAARTVLSA